MEHVQNINFYHAVVWLDFNNILFLIKLH